MAAATTSSVLSGGLVWSGPVDAPHGRGLHDRPTPTSGGLAIMAGVGLGGWVFAALAPPHIGGERAVAVALGFAALLGGVGAADDLMDFGAGAKLAAQAIASLLFAGLVAHIDVIPLGLAPALPLGAVIGIAGTALWLVVAGNAVNFMDGANGLAPGAIAIALAVLAVGGFVAGAPAVGGVALVSAAVGAGLLPWNVAGRLFQGDAGALFSSFLYAALCVIASTSHGPLFLYFGPLALLPFLTDVLLTLLVRARRREALMQAHRDHLYQLWLRRTGRPHPALAWRAWLIMAVAGAAALWLQAAPAVVQPPLFALAVVVCAAAWTWARGRLERGWPHD